MKRTIIEGEYIGIITALNAYKSDGVIGVSVTVAVWTGKMVESYRKYYNSIFRNGRAEFQRFIRDFELVTEDDRTDQVDLSLALGCYCVAEFDRECGLVALSPVYNDDSIDLSQERRYLDKLRISETVDNLPDIVKHYTCLPYNHQNFCWQEIMKKAVSLGYRSHQTSTCGLHIHVNRTAFGMNQAEQEDVIARLLYFVEAHWNEIYCFSRRKECNMNRWATRYGFEKTGREILDKAKNTSYGRYTAVNLCNYHTIEFRLFRGTLKHNTLIAALQLVDEICNAALFMSQEELELQSWTEFVKGIRHPELIQYLKERQLYVNDAVTDEEEV